MAGIDDVFERLVIDGDFRAALARDPHAALVEYDLTPADVSLLASRLDHGDEAQRAVEQRTSKSALLAALGMLGSGGEASDGIGGDETLTVGGNRTEGPADEYTKVPVPPAPSAPSAPPVPIPYPNTAEGEVGIESLELSTEGIDVEDTDAAAVTGSRKYGDITLKRGLTDDSGVVPGDDLAVSGDDVEVPVDDLAVSGDDVEVPVDDLAVAGEDVAVSGDGVAVSGDDVAGSGDDLAVAAGDAEPEAEPDDIVQASAQAGDGQADVVTAAGPGARPLGPEQDDDVFEIADANEVGGSGP